MLELARGGAAEGTWLRAESQTGGRGRQGREWVSPPGNLYASTLVRLLPGDPSGASLALVSAVALGMVIDTLGCPAVRIKWPNDLLIDGAKVAGILLERSGDAIVAGFGVNLSSHPVIDGRKATKLAGRAWVHSSIEVMDFLVSEFSEWLATWRNLGLRPIIRRWEQMALPLGTALVANLSDGSSERGVFDGLDPDGALRLRLASGEVRVIHAGDVFQV